MAKPYYHDETSGIAVYHGDARAILPALAPGSFDLCLADPPYGVTSLDWDRRVVGWPALVRPLLAASGSLWVFGSLRSHLETARDFAGWRLAQDMIWRKHNGTNLAADRFRRVHEQAVQWYAGRWEDVYKCPQYTSDATARVVRRKARPDHLGKRGDSTYVSHDGGPRLMTSVIDARTCHGEAVNETQKPVAIILPLLRYSCPPGGVVLDPFAGSGTTLVAARLLGMRAVGIEIRESQCREIVARLSQSVLPLGAAV